VNLQHLKTFLCVAELGSLSKASDRLRIAQPALSRQMRLLQEAVGVPLLERHRGGMRVTPAGRVMAERVGGLLRSLEQAYEGARSVPGQPRGQVALGIVPTVSHLLAGRVARRVATSYPDISLRIVESYSGHVVEWLQRGEIDAAIVYGPATEFHFRSADLLTEELMLVGHRGSTFPRDRPVGVAELAKLALVLPSRPHGLRMVVEGAAARARARLSVRFEADSFRVLKEMVTAGLGYTVLPYSAVAEEVAAGSLQAVALARPRVFRQLILGMPETGTTLATAKVVEMVCEEVASLVHSGQWRANLRIAHNALETLISRSGTQ
jgi:LysR family nitrogen assimilation transcriptional regulator